MLLYTKHVPCDHRCSLITGYRFLMNLFSINQCLIIQQKNQEEVQHTLKRISVVIILILMFFIQL